jgi:signal transduction histidine kinase
MLTLAGPERVKNATLGDSLLGVFEPIARSRLIPHRAARSELELELKRGKTAEAELQLAYGSLERKIEQHAIELAKANEYLKEQELNTTLFRIIQEALANIHKHANSKDAKIRLSGGGGKVVLEISDSGIGIDPTRLKNGRGGVSGFGVGITGMLERVRQLCRALEIEPANPGTLIRATFPLTKEKNNGNT